MVFQQVGDQLERVGLDGLVGEGKAHGPGAGQLRHEGNQGCDDLGKEITHVLEILAGCGDGHDHALPELGVVLAELLELLEILPALLVEILVQDHLGQTGDLVQGILAMELTPVEEAIAGVPLGLVLRDQAVTESVEGLDSVIEEVVGNVADNFSGIHSGSPFVLM